VRKKSIVRVAVSIKSVEMIDGSKFLGRILTKDGRAFHLIKGDKLILVRRKRVVYPK
jgi:hypothetical protein